MRAYVNPNPQPVASIDAFAADAAAEQSRLNQETLRCAEITRYDQDSRSFWIRLPFLNTCLTRYAQAPLSTMKITQLEMFIFLHENTYPSTLTIKKFQSWARAAR